MVTVSIVGTGHMGSALAGLVTRAGHALEQVGSHDLDTPITGDLVVLAVPYPAVDDVLTQRGDQLSGRIVVDITNPVNFATLDSLTVAADSSATAEIAARLPNSRVLKAFNTTFAATLTAGTVGPVTTTVLIAGDDTDAKTTLAEVITAAGLNAIDVGPLARARELEAIGFVQISLAAAEKISWTGGFGLVP